MRTARFRLLHARRRVASAEAADAGRDLAARGHTTTPCKPHTNTGVCERTHMAHMDMVHTRGACERCMQGLFAGCTVSWCGVRAWRPPVPGGGRSSQSHRRRRGSRVSLRVRSGRPQSRGVRRGSTSARRDATAPRRARRNRNKAFTNRGRFAIVFRFRLRSRVRSFHIHS